MQRVGDKFVEFSDGVFATNDPELIAWCEAKYPDVMDAEEASTPALVALARLQTPRQDYEPDSSIDLVGIASESINQAVKLAVEKALANSNNTTTKEAQ